MASTINTNIISINAQRNLSASTSSLATSMQRLSSGLRVNSAKDDAAGLAIAERMNTQVKGLTVAARNANDGISLAQTAEGALGKVGDMLQRMRELSVQAGNATNSKSDRQALQAEVSQLAAEIDRVAKQTNFNGQKLLEGSFAGAVFQVGANAGDNITLGSLADTRASQISNISYASATDTFNTSDSPVRAIANFDQAIPDKSLSITVGTGANAYTVALEQIAPATSSLERMGQVVTAINNRSADTGVTAYLTPKDGSNDYTIELMSSKLDENGQPVDISFNNFSATTTGVGGNIATDVPPADYVTALQTAATTTPFNQNNYNAALDKVIKSNPALLTSNSVDNGTVNRYSSYKSSPTPANATLLATALDAATISYKSTPNLVDLKAEYDKVMLDPSSTQSQKATTAEDYRNRLNSYLPVAPANPAGSTVITDAMLPNDWDTAIQTLETAAARITYPNDLNVDVRNYVEDDRGIDIIDVSTQAGAWIALQKIDSAIDQVNGARATLGAMQSRFENAVSNIDIQSENLSAARGRIIDADFAKETANLSRTQILQQAGTAMVAQANQIPQQVLQLLQK